MNSDDVPPLETVTDRIHPDVSKAIIAFAALYLIAAWAGFFILPRMAFVLTVVSGLFLVAVVLLTILFRFLRRRRDRAPAADRMGFADWLESEIGVLTGRLKGSVAATQILTPIAAVALGMVCFALVLRLEGLA
jgi:hypothetical protein